MHATIFSVLAFSFSWGLYYSLHPIIPQNAQMFLAVGFMFGPLVAALVMKAIDRRPGMLALNWRFNIWWLIAWLIPPVLAALAIAASLAMPGAVLRSFESGLADAVSQLPPEAAEAALAKTPPIYLIALISMLAGIFPNAIAAFGEEAGWRGYLWSALRSLGFWRANLLIGVVWGVWHAPLIMAGHNYGLDYPFSPWAGVAMMTAFTVGLSPVLALVRDRSNSVIPAAILHGTVNATAGVGAMFIAGGSPLLRNLPGAAGVAVLILVAAVIAATGLSKRPAAEAPSG